MATLRLSTAAVSSTVVGPSAGTLMTTSASTSASLISGSATAGVSILIIYRGTPATFPSFTDRSTRSADVLITFTLPTGLGFLDLGIVTESARFQIGRHLPNQAASASGTASWFLLCRSGTTSLTDKGAMVGSVGVLGSGSDLEIPDLNIVSGQNYQSAGFFINMPQNWTV